MIFGKTRLEVQHENGGCVVSTLERCCQHCGANHVRDFAVVMSTDRGW